jgi:CheY-like chemotaxis protein
MNAKIESQVLVGLESDVDRLILTSILKKAGYNVVQRRDAKEVESAFNNDIPDILFIDLYPPDLLARQVVEGLRSMHGFSVPIIVVAREIDSETYSKCLDAGADDVLILPFSVEIILSKTRALLRGRGVDKKPSAQEAPKVFISYSHDSHAHSGWVLKLAAALQTNGVNIFLDVWDVGPGDSLLRFMHRAINESKKILVVCTDAYAIKADSGLAGAGYEAQILAADSLRDVDQNKCVPILRSLRYPDCVPRFLRGRMFCDFSDDCQFDQELEGLLRYIHDSPVRERVRPPLGKNPFYP